MYNTIIIVAYFRGVYISQNENFRKDCTCKVAALGMWVWFSINFAKKIYSEFNIHEICDRICENPTFLIMFYFEYEHMQVYGPQYWQ